MLSDQFRQVRKTPGQREIFQGIMDRVIGSVDYSEDKIYKRGEYNGKIGILQKIKEVYVWCWINTINTNYSCIEVIIDFLNSVSPNKLTFQLFLKSKLEFNELFQKNLYEFKDVIFKKGSEVFTKMFFITQKTWNDGLISTINVAFTISEHFKTSISLNYNRGENEDMNEGCDFIIEIEDEHHRTQHKKIRYLNKENDFYKTDRFEYNEKTYRKYVDLISIDHGDKIYLFKNSKDNELCGTDYYGVFYIHESLLIKVMKKENQIIEKLLLDLNRLCFEKRIIFSFTKGDSGENYFEQENISDTVRLSFYLNDVNDKKLSAIIQEQINKLK